MPVSHPLPRCCFSARPNDADFNVSKRGLGFHRWACVGLLGSHWYVHNTKGPTAIPLTMLQSFCYACSLFRRLVKLWRPSDGGEAPNEHPAGRYGLCGAFTPPFASCRNFFANSAQFPLVGVGNNCEVANKNDMRPLRWVPNQGRWGHAKSYRKRRVEKDRRIGHAGPGICLPV